MKTLIVPKKYNEKKLNKFLLDSFNGLSQNTLFKAYRKKDIIVNDKRISENITVYENDKITIYITDDFLYKKVDFEIIYEDNNIVLVNKPCGIEIQGENSLTSLLKQNNNYVFLEPCHRLDRNTTGIVLFSKNKEALEILLSKFKNKEIDKFYKCLVYGIPKEKSKTLEAYLFKDTKKSLVYISDTFKKGYQKIITSYKVLKEDKTNNISLLEIKLETGRTHQIRAHLSHIGYPILGDRKIWEK